MSISPAPKRLNWRDRFAVRLLARIHVWRARQPAHHVRRRRIAAAVAWRVSELMIGWRR